MRNWYAVHCKAQQDARAEENLSNQGFEVFRPMVRLRKKIGAGFREVVESMFPRYLFIHLDNVADNWSPIRSTRGVADMVRWNACVPSIPDIIVQEIRDRVDERNSIDITNQYHFKERDRVRITEGPFAGHEGLFNSRKGEERVVVLLDIMQRWQRLELSERYLETA